LRRGDFIVIGVLLLVSFVGLYYFVLRSDAPPAAQIVIQVDGEDKFSFPLHEVGRDQEIKVQGINGITLVHLAEDRVWVEDSACPDKICVHTGWSNSPLKPIACLPNRVIIKIVGEADGDYDLR